MFDESIDVWRPYIRDRLIYEDSRGFFVIVPENNEPSIPLACDVCKRLYRSQDDEVSHHEFACCYLCALRWAHPRRKEWLAGWRPSSDAVKAVVAEASQLVTIDVGK